MLLEGGVDAALARHIAHLFVRDPLVIFDDAIEVDDTKTTEHFENIQVRSLPPSLPSSCLWFSFWSFSTMLSR